MPAESVRTSKPSTAPPAAAGAKLATANEFLLSAMQALVPLAIMLTSERFPTDCAYEWSLVRMCAKMRSKIVSPSKFLWAKVTLERCRVFLDTLFCPRSRWSRRVGKFEDVIPIRDRRGRRAPRRGSRCGRSVSGARSAMGVTGVVRRERSMSLVDL